MKIEDWNWKMRLEMKTKIKIWNEIENQIKHWNKKFKIVDKGDSVIVSVLDIERGRGNFSNVCYRFFSILPFSGQ